MQGSTQHNGLISGVQPPQPSGLIDTPEAITNVVDTLAALPWLPPSLFVDLEGVNLSRQGTISILQVHVSPSDRTYLVDIHSLGFRAFHTPGTDGHTTLKSIFESSAVIKVFFDVRNDSDALYAHFGIKLAGIQDLQLMELATRSPELPRKYVNGLVRCIEKDAALPPNEIQRCKTVKDKGIMLFAPERGGSYDVFNARPLSEDIKAYCVQDVKVMPRLWTGYNARLTSTIWRTKLESATRNRVAMSQSPWYNGKGAHMKFGPW
ncbi:MAG: hypothetical protein Q9168_000123 [Polycauliona sp. 1 TL-2023]